MMTMRWASFFLLLLLVAAVASSTPQRNNLRRLDDADPEEKVEIEEALEPEDEEEEEPEDVAEPEEEVRGTEPPKEYPEEEEERGTEPPKEDVPPEEKPAEEEGTSETTEPPAGDEEKEPTEPSEGTEAPAEETEPGDDEDDADDDGDDGDDDADDADDGDDVEDVDADEDEDDADDEDDGDDADLDDEIDELGTPAPTYAEWPPDDNTAKPPAAAPSGEVNYTPEPTYEYDEDYTDIIIDRPTPEPEVYVPTDDDPLKPQTEGTGYNWPQPGETPEEMVKDRNVLIALGCVFGVGVLLMIVTAQQMMENPDGCCASTCRLIVGCSCCIFRTICFPCRAICCPNKRGARHHAMLSENNSYTHDLELS